VVSRTFLSDTDQDLLARYLSICLNMRDRLLLALSSTAFFVLPHEWAFLAITFVTSYNMAYPISSKPNIALNQCNENNMLGCYNYDILLHSGNRGRKEASNNRAQLTSKVETAHTH
jgi:hypothetical protein